MYKLLTQKGQMIALLLGVAIIAIFLITVFTGIGDAGYSAGDDLNKIMKDNPGTDIGFFNFGLGATIALVVAAAAAWFLFGAAQLLSSPKQAMKSLAAIAALGILIFALYSMSDAETAGRIGELVQIHDMSETTSKMISAGIKTTVFLAIASAATMVVAEVINIFK